MLRDETIGPFRTSTFIQADIRKIPLGDSLFRQGVLLRRAATHTQIPKPPLAHCCRL